MKKKLATLLTMVLCVSTVAACGKQTPAEPVNDDTTPTVVESVSEASTDASTEASTEEVVEATEETKTEASREYTVDYIKSSINPEDGVELSFDQNGVSMTMGVKDGDSKLLYLVMERALENDKNQSAFYVVGDDIYMCMGANDNYVLKTHSKDSDGSFTSNAEESTGGFVQDTDDVVDVQFVEVTEVEGVSYDVVKVTTKDNDSADYYFNSESGELSYIKANENGQEAFITVKKIGTFIEPDWFKECTEDETDGAGVMMQFMSVMLMPMVEEVITEDMVAEMTNGEVSIPFDGTLESSDATEGTSNN